MPFDKPTRNALARMVAQARETLKTDLTAQLQTEFRLQADGNHLPLTGLPADQREAARALRALLDHYAAQLPNQKAALSQPQAFDRLAREIGFTVLNRLAALRLAEERGLVVECVRQGVNSEGFRLFERMLGGGLPSRYAAYRLFLENLFDELALDLGALFDRAHPLSAPFPTERALTRVLELLNDPALAAIWGEDETIGWIYQYYNDEAERKQMRDESQAPRNSRELAVRNQFFTPRYVVEFLTDNTLGRLWYEMTGGQTRLAEQCRYLVKATTTDDRSARPTMDNPHSEISNLQSAIRNLKDPREITMLDPAAGSGHFALYCFDLFETIYEEAWELQANGTWPMADGATANNQLLITTYPTLESLRLHLPRLILQHNLHIIDIDPRAVQIAALALWLRAQRRWQSQGVRAADRPRITRMNVVCAEPMPGERDLLEEFITTHLSADGEGAVLAGLLRVVFEKMQLAGEAGSLLKIEDELREAIAAAKKEWVQGPRYTQSTLLPSPRGRGAGGEGEQAELGLDTTGITDERFWDDAETRLLAALQAYAETATAEAEPPAQTLKASKTTKVSPHTERSRSAPRRKLFADDAAHGFAFIDLCRKRYDVVLMNPPFGRSSSDTDEFIKQNYKDAYIDVYACFISRGIELNVKGYLGAITARSYFNAVTLERFRKNIIPRLEILIDLGGQVLDTALVDTALCVLGDNHQELHSLCIGASAIEEKNSFLSDAISQHNNAIAVKSVYVKARSHFLSTPNSQLLYDLDYKQVEGNEKFGLNACEVRAGLSTFDDFRFLRVYWEVRANDLGKSLVWTRHAKGGDFETYYGDLEIVSRWAGGSQQMIQLNIQKHGQPWQAQQSSAFYFQHGVSYTYRSSRGFNAKVFPADCTFAVNGPVIQPHKFKSMYYVLAWINSETIRSLVQAQANSNLFTPGILKNLPWVTPDLFTLKDVEKNAKEIVLLKRMAYAKLETEPHFSAGSLLVDTQKTLQELSLQIVSLQNRMDDEIVNMTQEIERKISALYPELRLDFQTYNVDSIDHKLNQDIKIDDKNIAECLVSLLAGCAFARWDIRLALDPTLAPKLQDPFEPLPVCPPGMLVGVNGLPATPGGIVSEAWLRARPNAITLPTLQEDERRTTKDEKTSSSVLRRSSATIPDSAYPLPLAWDGVLVDDPNLDVTGAEHPHTHDIISRLRAALTVLWGARAEAIEAEACELLGVKTLRDYFRNFNKGFFADHLKRYSKSRRQAPIYWPLSVPSGRYTLWVYYHRLDGGTLHHLVNDYVSPKIDQVDDQLNAARSHSAPSQSQIATLQSLLAELRDFRAELLRVAGLPYTPNLNDGVLLNAAPLHKLFRHSNWAKDCQAAWQSLENGEYEWAHLAYTLWPDRVRQVCAQDRSIAIAHGLESLYQGEVKVKKTRKKKETKSEGGEEVPLDF